MSAEVATPSFTTDLLHAAGFDGVAGALVALDVDGTILGHDGSMTERVREAVAAVGAAGAHVVLSTGRSIPAVLPVLQQLGLETGWAVCSNGAVTIEFGPEHDGGYRLAEIVTFDAAQAVRAVLAEEPDTLVAVEDLGKGYRVTGHFPPGELEHVTEVVDVEALIAQPVTRVALRAPHHDAAYFNALVQRIGLHGVSYSIGWTAWLDLAPSGVSKASALSQVAGALGIEQGRVLAAGDGQNDREMLSWAGFGVAMGDADAGTVALADAVTAPVASDGVVPVLRSLLP